MASSKNKLEGNGPVESAASRATEDKQMVLLKLICRWNIFQYDVKLS